MKEYRLLMQTMVSGIPWEYTLHQASDEIAIDFAKRILNSTSWPSSCMAVLLFNIDDDRLVTEFRLNDPQLVQRG